MLTDLFRFQRNRTLNAQIEAYIAWKSLQAPTMAQTQLPTLLRFARFADIEDVSDIQMGHIHGFEELLKQQCTTMYAEDVAYRAMRGFLRYHHARGHLCPAAEVVGKSRRQIARVGLDLSFSNYKGYVAQYIFCDM